MKQILYPLIFLTIQMGILSYFVLEKEPIRVCSAIILLLKFEY